MSAAEKKGLLNRMEAAKHLGLKIKRFERHVKPHVPHVVIGTLWMYKPEDLDQWVDEKRVGGSAESATTPRGTSDSRTTARTSISPQARRILARLGSKPKGSISKLFPVDEPQK